MHNIKFNQLCLITLERRPRRGMEERDAHGTGEACHRLWHPAGRESLSAAVPDSGGYAGARAFP